jgi:hypothetical protein
MKHLLLSMALVLASSLGASSAFADCVAWDHIQLTAATGTVLRPLRVSASMDCSVGQLCDVKIQFPGSDHPWEFRAERSGTAQSPGRLVVHFLEHGTDTSTILPDNQSTQIPIGQAGTLRIEDRQASENCDSAD